MVEPASEFAQWAITDRQREILQAWESSNRSLTETAKLLGIKRNTVWSLIDRIRKRAARSGYAPAHDYRHPVPDGFLAKGVSNLYDGEGQLRLSWVKSSIDRDRQLEIVQACVNAMAEEIRIVDPIPTPKRRTIKELANVYVLADGHLGMFADPEENGEECWGLEAGARKLEGGMRYLIENAPRAGTAIIAQLGDFLHYDTLDSLTPRHKNPLDADARIAQIAEAAIRILRSMVESALTHHSRVKLLIAEGNHDPMSALWLRLMFRELYKRNSRLEVIDQRLPYYQTNHGKTFLGFHHGHVKNIRRGGHQLALIFADTKEWAESHGGHRYIHTAHYHESEEIGVHGAKLVQHPTFAPRDAYAARSGWKPQREMRAITYHSEHGETGRLSITPGMIA